MRKDFRSAIDFTQKLNEVQTTVEPLENVLEFYGGNQDKMRKTISDEEYEKIENVRDDSNLKMIKSINKNTRGNLCIAPKSFLN